MIRRPLPALPAALLLASALAARADFAPPCHRTPAGCGGLPRNFAEVAPGVLYRGSQPDRGALERLQARYAIRTVVNLRRLHSDRGLVEPLGLRLIRIPNWATHAEDEDVGAFLRVAADPANRPVFLHCKYGSDRTGLMVAAWRLLLQQPPPPDAEVEAELRAFEFHDYRSVLKWIRRVEALPPAERARLRERLMTNDHP